MVGILCLPWCSEFYLFLFLYNLLSSFSFLHFPFTHHSTRLAEKNMTLSTQLSSLPVSDTHVAALTPTVSARMYPSTANTALLATSPTHTLSCYGSRGRRCEIFCFKVNMTSKLTQLIS